MRALIAGMLLAVMVLGCGSREPRVSGLVIIDSSTPEAFDASWDAMRSSLPEGPRNQVRLAFEEILMDLTMRIFGPGPGSLDASDAMDRMQAAMHGMNYMEIIALEGIGVDYDQALVRLRALRPTNVPPPAETPAAAEPTVGSSR